MVNSIEEMRIILEQKKGERNLLTQQKKDFEDTIKKLIFDHENAIKARTIVQKVAEDTQKNIEYHISNLVSMAIASIFPDPYEFNLIFVQRRNKMEADLIFTKNGNETSDLIFTAGGGVVDVASFALRISVWSIGNTRPVIVLDEPGKFISRNLQAKFSKLIKTLSEKLQIQFLIVSHVPEICESADRIFSTEYINKTSHVEVSDGCGKSYS